MTPGLLWTWLGSRSYSGRRQVLTDSSGVALLPEAVRVIE